MQSKILFGALLVALSSNVSANTASSTINVEVENRAITLTSVAGLNFGKILPFGSAGSVTVSVTGVATASNAFIADASDAQASSWTVNGVPGAPYAISLPSSNVTITNGTENMTVSNFTRSGGSTQLFLDAGGNANFNVGARLNVGANQPAGVYAGTFNVTVNYN